MNVFPGFYGSLTVCFQFWWSESENSACPWCQQFLCSHFGAHRYWWIHCFHTWWILHS